jgi:hypothetical protein
LPARDPVRLAGHVREKTLLFRVNNGPPASVTGGQTTFFGRSLVA